MSKEEDVPGIDQPVSFQSDDVRMQFAIDEARASIRTFLHAFLTPNPKQKSFLLKVKFTEGNQIEHIWLADIKISGKILSGAIANPPSLKGLSYKQRVNFKPEFITDWMYLEDDYLVGGFTIQVIRAAMSPEERKAHDAATPFKFRD